MKNRFRNVRWVILLALVVGLLLPSGAYAVTKIHLGIIRSVTALPLFWLQEQDLKKDFGIDLKMTIFPRPTEMYTAFKGKRTDASYIGIVTAHNLMRGGIKVNLVRPWIYPRQFGILVRKDSPFKLLRDLKGHTYASASISGTEYIISRLAFQIVGVDMEKEIRVTTGPPSASVGAIAAGKLDAGILWHPTLAKAMATGDFRILAKPQLFLEGQFGSLFPQFAIGFHRDFFKANRPAVKRFVKALDMAVARTYSHPDEVNRIAAKKLNLDLKMMEDIRDYFGEAWLRTGLNDRVYKEIQDFYVLVKGLKMIETVPNARDFWTIP